MSINGLPLHPLVVHAVVVLSPLAALLGIAYAVRPGWRWALRWVLVLVTLGAALSAFVASKAGDSLMAARGLHQLPTVRAHENAGHLLTLLLLVDLLVVALAAWWLGGPSALVSGRGARTVRGGVLDLLVSVLLVLVSLAVLYAVVRAGDTGAQAVWG
jgi:hypothetical protein